MEPDQIVQQGIRMLQNKIGGLLKGLNPDKWNDDDAPDGPRSPDMNVDGGTTPWQDAGYQSAYDPGSGSATGYGGATSSYAPNSGPSYGGGSGTPFGMTPYGQSWQ